MYFGTSSFRPVCQQAGNKADSVKLRAPFGLQMPEIYAPDKASLLGEGLDFIIIGRLKS